jgi:hypothetical protein
MSCFADYERRNLEIETRVAGLAITTCSLPPSSHTVIGPPAWYHHRARSFSFDGAGAGHILALCGSQNPQGHTRQRKASADCAFCRAAQRPWQAILKVPLPCVSQEELVVCNSALATSRR